MANSVPQSAVILSSLISDNGKQNHSFIIETIVFHLATMYVWKTLTRAPRGTDRSPEYNEYFCY